VFRPSAESARNRSHGGPAPRLTRSPHQRNRKPTDTALCQSQCGPTRHAVNERCTAIRRLATICPSGLFPSGRLIRPISAQSTVVERRVTEDDA
jgi:hypothetical protein